MTSIAMKQNFGGYQHLMLLDSDDDDDGEIAFGTFRAAVVGIRYYRGQVNNHEMVALRREPNNKYDRNAIRVDNVYGQQVGHIKREQAAVLSQMVDRKYAKIEGVVPFGSNNQFTIPCEITLRGSPTNAEHCKNEMKKRGYPLRFPGQESQPGHKGTPQASYKAKNNTSRELVKIPQQKMKHELDNLFANIIEADKQKVMEPSNVITTGLFPHQKQALAWMVSRENTDELPPFWEQTKTGLYKSSLTNFQTTKKPCDVLGGMLADDMGLGKTLSIISLIVTNFRKEKPLVTIDKSVLVTVEESKNTNTKGKTNVKKKRGRKCVTNKLDECEKKICLMKEDISEMEEDEPELPSFDVKEDVDYKPAFEVASKEVETISSQRPKRKATRNPKYNFDNDDWLLDSPEKPKRKKRNKKNTPKPKTEECKMEEVVDLPDCTITHVEDIKDGLEERHDVIRYQVTKTEMAGPRATLIVCPLSVLPTWQEQFEMHIERGAIDVYTYYGGDKIKNSNVLSQKDVVLTTYQTLSSDYTKKNSPLTKTTWLRIVLDEGHVIRNAKSNQSKACHALIAERRWVITGTPIQNSIKDLWSVICFLRLEPFTKKEWWRRTIQRPISNGEKSALSRLQCIVKKIAMRRTKTQEVKGKKIVELPQRTVFIQKIQLSSEERKLYETFKNEGKNIMKRYVAEKNLLSNYAHVLVILMRLRQLCCHPKLCAQILNLVSNMAKSSSATPDELEKKLQQILAVLLSSGDEECPICLDSLNQPVITHCAHLYCRPCIESVIQTDARACAKCPMCRGDIDKTKLVEPAVEESVVKKKSEDTWSSSSKVDGLITLLNREKEEDPLRKSLVVSQFSSFLDLLEKPLQQSGFHFVRLDGSMTLRRRADVINMFSQTAVDSPTIMLLSLKAGGVGINLTAATRIFLMDPAWNPASEDQCFDRCHRLGQTKEVKIFKFIVKDSVEERMLELQDKKRALMAGAFGKKITAKEKQERRILDVQHLFT